MIFIFFSFSVMYTFVVSVYVFCLYSFDREIYYLSASSVCNNITRMYLVFITPLSIVTLLACILLSKFELMDRTNKSKNDLIYFSYIHTCQIFLFSRRKFSIDSYDPF